MLAKQLKLDYCDPENQPTRMERLCPSAVNRFAGKPTRDERERIQRYNLAIWRIVHGTGPMLRELEVITGLSEASLSKRCHRAERVFNEDELNCYDGTLSESDRRHLLSTYMDSDDPAVQAFLIQNCRPSDN